MKKTLIYLGATAFINIAIRILSRTMPAFSEWYAYNIYPLIVNISARISGVFPFSVIEVLLYIFISAIITGTVVLVIKLIKQTGKRKKVLLTAFLALSCVVSSVALIFLFGCEINYQREPFSRYSGLSPEMYTANDLRLVIDEVVGELNLISAQINTDADGGFVLSIDDFKLKAQNSMGKLGEIYPCLDTYYPKPKPVLMSEQFLSRSLICGIFSPFTIEANYNSKMPDSEMPFTVCHELSHLSGFMREDEANFISFLACRESGDAEFRYSGYIHALTYLINEYYTEVTPEEYYYMYMTIPEQVRRDFAITNEYWRTYYDTPVSKAAGAVNDTYLKSNGQTDGVKSYGRFVELLIADYINRK